MSAVAEGVGLYGAAFERFRARNEFAPARWLGRLRQTALDDFFERGFPTTRDEEWKYTRVGTLARTEFERAAEPASMAAEVLESLEPAGAFECRRFVFVFVNGRFRKDLSCQDGLPGVAVSSLTEALAGPAERLKRYFERGTMEDGQQVFARLNTAFFEDGVLVEVAPGTVAEQPLQIIHLSIPGDGARPTVSYPRTFVLAGRNSQLSLVESYVGQAGRPYFTNAVTEVWLEQGAHLERIKVQRESVEASHIAALVVRQGRDSRFTDVSVSLGGGLVRNDIHARFDGQGGECGLYGLFVASGSQHMDTHSTVDHALPHCQSRELYKGVLDGRSRGVFHGRVLVQPDAQKTDAWQANHNLLLSPEALVNSTPQLVIHADDVKCKHASTTGQLDAEALFYLRSRGLGEQAARALLTQAFAAEVLTHLRVPSLRKELEAFLHERLPQEPEEAAC